MNQVIKWNQKLLTTLMIIVLSVAIAACGTKDIEKEPVLTPESSQAAASVAPSEQPEATPEAAAKTEYPLVLKDDTAVEVTFEEAPKAVVTLLPSETEIMYAIGAGEKVAGVDNYSNYPEEAGQKPKIGDMELNMEALLALEPDLVLASSSMNAQAIESLRGLNIKVYATDPKNYDAVIEKITVLGQIMDSQQSAAEVAGKMEQVRNDVMEKTKAAEAKSVFYEVFEGYTVGGGEFIDSILEMAGGRNIAHEESGWFESDAEFVIGKNPQVILYSSMEGDNGSQATAIAARAGWDVIDAVKEKQIFPITDDLISRVGPRLADGLLEVAKALHPELFAGK